MFSRCSAGLKLLLDVYIELTVVTRSPASRAPNTTIKYSGILGSTTPRVSPVCKFKDFRKYLANALLFL